MFRTDKKSLEKLSFALDERDIANFKHILNYLQKEGFLTISAEEAKRTLDGLEEIGSLKLNGKVYAFHVSDSYAGGGEGDEGVELYLRQGDILEDFYVPDSRDWVYSAEECAEYLKEQKVSKIYTGQIPFDSHFLELNQKDDEEDPVIRDILTDEEIREFKERKIEVVSLDSLI